MSMDKKIEASRRMGTSAFKNEINHLLHSNSHIGFKGELDAGWNSRDHALVMALLLKRKGSYPKIASGKCMFVQGPYLRYSSFGVGQEHDYISGHSWVLDPKFDLIDVSPFLEIKKHRFRASFDGIFGRVWLPRDKEKLKVVVCNDLDTYEQEISKASHLTGQSTAVYMHLEDFEVTESLIESPFKFLGSELSDEIKRRFGSDFYPAVVSHLQSFMLGESDSLKGMEKLKAWSAVFDKFPA
jgi:hypothetical protein